MNKLNHSDEAFIKAYASNVDNAPEDVVRKFLELEDHTEFYAQHWDCYGSIADAYGVWNAARESLKRDLQAALAQVQAYSDNEFVIGNGHDFKIADKLEELK